MVPDKRGMSSCSRPQSQSAGANPKEAMRRQGGLTHLQPSRCRMVLVSHYSCSNHNPDLSSQKVCADVDQTIYPDLGSRSQNVPAVLVVKHKILNTFVAICPVKIRSYTK